MLSKQLKKKKTFKKKLPNYKNKSKLWTACSMDTKEKMKEWSLKKTCKRKRLKNNKLNCRMN